MRTYLGREFQSQGAATKKALSQATTNLASLTDRTHTPTHIHTRIKQVVQKCAWDNGPSNNLNLDHLWFYK